MYVFTQHWSNLFYCLMGFLNPSPPSLGERPEGLHITYLNRLVLPEDKVEAFIKDIEFHTARSQHIEVKLHDGIHYFGDNGEYKVQLVHSDPHVELYEVLLRTAEKHEGKCVTKYEYNPHITHTGERITHMKVEHLSLVRHHDLRSSKVQNIKNFMLGTA